MTGSTRAAYAHLDAHALDSLLSGGFVGPEDVGVENLREPVVTVSVTAAGPALRLRHWFMVGESDMTMVLALDEERWVVSRHPAAFLAAMLVRTLRLETNPGPQGRAALSVAPDDQLAAISIDSAPRIRVQRHLGVDSAWHITVDVLGRRTAEMFGTDDTFGTRLLKPGTCAVEPISNRELYRIFTSLLQSVTAQD